MGIIALEGMEFFAYHGCFEEERLMGGRFLIDITISANTETAEQTDDLNQTVDYKAVYEAMKEEVEIKAKLLEHLARRIADRLMSNFPAIQGLIVKVSKLNPPVGGMVNRVSVSVCAGDCSNMK
jgi:7,8-dihydroneopterin aldolase/epimerase/oxygenase